VSRFIDLTLNGISNGMIYAAVALSLVLIWRATRIINFAQGGMLMITTFIASSVISSSGSYWLGFVIALVSGLLLGAVVERVLVRRVEGGPPLNAVIATLGLLILLQAVAGMIWGGTPRSFPPAFSIRGYEVSGRHVLFGPFDTFTVLAVLGMTVALALLFRGTGLGLQMRAAAFDPLAARLQGVRVTRRYTVGWALVPALVAATAAAALIGVVLGVVAARLRGPYLAGATLAFAVGLPGLADRYPHAFGGENGLIISPPKPPAGLGSDFPLERWEAWIACIAALLAFLALSNLKRSRVGRVLRAVRDDEVAAQLAGLNVARTQVTAFIVSAACAGLAGGTLAVVTQLAAPGAFGLALSLSLLTGIVLGGLGSLPGALWGAIAPVMLPAWSDDLASHFSLSNDVQSNLPLALYGVVLMGVIVAAPEGIQGALRRFGRRVRPRRSISHQEAA
jgi:branched-chain amino acid transport system permease protein